MKHTPAKNNFPATEITIPGFLTPMPELHEIRSLLQSIRKPEHNSLASVMGA